MIADGGRGTLRLVPTTGGHRWRRHWIISRPAATALWRTPCLLRRCKSCAKQSTTTCAHPKFWATNTAAPTAAAGLASAAGATTSCNFAEHYAQSSKVLLTSTTFDRTCAHPAVMPLVRAVLGDDAVIEEHSVMLRRPVAERPQDGAPYFPQSWHRDGGGKIDKSKCFTIFMCQVCR